MGGDGTSVTMLAYGTPEEGYRLGQRGISNGNRGMIWEQALTACGYNALRFRQNFLDAGGHLLENISYSGLGSDSGEASTDSDGSEAEGITHFGPERKRLGYADCKQQQRSVGDQDWDPILFAGINRVVLPSLQDRTFNQHAEDSNLVLPSVQNILDWQPTVPEASPVAAPSAFPFRRSFYTLPTQHDHVPIMETNPAEIDPWAWNRSVHSNHEDHFNPLRSDSNHYAPQSQTDNTPWSYISTPYQGQAPQTDLRIQDLHLLEGDANVWSQ